MDLSYVSLSTPFLHLLTIASLSLCYLCQTDIPLHKNVILYNLFCCAKNKHVLLRGNKKENVLIFSTTNMVVLSEMKDRCDC